MVAWSRTSDGAEVLRRRVAEFPIDVQPRGAVTHVGSLDHELQGELLLDAEAPALRIGVLAGGRKKLTPCPMLVSSPALERAGCSRPLGSGLALVAMKLRPLSRVAWIGVDWENPVWLVLV